MSKRIMEAFQNRAVDEEIVESRLTLFESAVDIASHLSKVSESPRSFPHSPLSTSPNSFISLSIARFNSPTRCREMWEMNVRLLSFCIFNLLDLLKMMAMEVTQILLNAQAVDGALRKQAEENLKQFQEQNLPSFLFSLAGELANDDKPAESRKLAGLILKNALDAKEQHRKIEFVQRWLALDPTLKAQIKAFLLRTLSSPSLDARSTASQVIAKVAGIELPHKQWPELIGSLLSNVHQLPAPTRQATLETLGYICEEVSPDVVDQEHVNKILTAVVQGMNSTEENNDVRLAAIKALYNALGFAQANFSNDMERDYIMRIVCEATQSPELKIRRAAFECLVAISSTYYEKLAHYIQDIFNITAKAVKEDEEPVALQAIEFWSSICDEEIDILEEYGGDFSGDSDVPCFYFIKQALSFLVPMLLETLLKQEEDQDQDEGAWNIAMAGGTCLGLVARTVGDDIVALVMPFIEENITKQDWRQREAATYAFGSILEGPSPDKLVPLVNMALNFMLSALMKDPNNHVKDTTAWTLGRMFEFLHGSALDTPIITPANCQQIITVLVQSMKDVPNVAEKACGALYFLAQGYEDAGSSSSPLTPFFQEIVQALLNVTHREDAGESRLRTAAYEALNEVVRCSNDETAPMVVQLVPVIMLELHQTLENQVSSDERQNELQGLLCGCLQVIIQKLGSSEPTKYHFMQYADQIMGLFLRVFASRSATAHEEAMLAIGALAYATGADFAKYMTEFYKYLEMGLQNFEDYQVCAITVGVVGDVCRALEEKILPYCDGIMTQLLKDLSSNQLHRSVKPPIFSCFGDIALAIGENFEKYLIYAMPMLQSAAELSAHTAGADDDMTEYTNSLRNGILEAYSGIFQGFKGSPKTQLLLPYAPHVLQFLDSLYMEKDMDDVVTKTAIGVLGDLADTLGNSAGHLIQQSVSSKDFLKECLSSDDHLIKESAEWAKLAISRAISF
ncbi:Importin subunit beta-1 [Vigna angularis]|uniref:Importin subunit beta-1 n=3 Tax=Phaseolus angularis TaxID=3914 RepID=A0A8T0LJA5_PHAAN|nr:Importin subunit beta-1 [Vigna angularis]